MKARILGILFALVLVLVFSLVMAAPAVAYVGPADVWVDDDWAGSNPGDLVGGHTFGTDAFATITDALAVVVSPGTVHVAAGTYTENITLVDGVEVLGAGADVTTIDGGGSSRVVSADGVGATTVLDGFTITNGNAANGGGMRNINGSSTVISNCIFDDNDATYGAGMYNSASSPTVVNCIFSDNNATTQGGGMYNVDCTTAPTVINCTFEDNYGVVGGGGGIYNSNSGTTVTNCIFWNNTGSGSSNIGWVGSPAPVVSYCDIQGGYAGGTDILNTDPLFVNAALNDYHLQTGSPCIDAGDDTAVPGWLTTDFEGQPRIADGNDDTIAVVDMGADEYPAPPTEVWVDDGWTSQTDVDVFDLTLTWQYDAFDSIQDGIDAVSGSTVHVLAGTYYENITLVDGVDVLGAGAGSSTIDGGASGPVVTADGVGELTTLDGFTITNGSGYDTGSQTYGGGMFIINGSSLTVSNCTLSGNTAYFGGGISNIESSPTLENCTFDSNTASGSTGGGIYNTHSSPTVTGCTFTGNTANLYGGGMYNSNQSSPTVTGCTFTGNTATNGGGGMHNGNNSNPTVTDCTFDGTNSAIYGGGMKNEDSSPTVTGCTFTGNTATEGAGMYNITNSSPQVTNCTFSHNSATQCGGGMANYNNSSPTLSGCTFSYNDATYGGGLYNSASSPTVESGCTFDHNTALYYGGGMYNGGSSAAVTGCTFTANYTTNNYGYGGGMYNSSSSATVTGCTFTANYTAGTYSGGGGMYNSSCSSSLTVSDCDFSTNSATYGGGMYNYNNSSPTVENGCTFTANTAQYGGGMYNYESDPAVTGCDFDTNDADYFGGGMLNDHSNPTVTGCTFSNNVAEDGAGMDNGYSQPIVTDCNFNSNEATSDGGGMYNYDSDAMVTGCTFSGNTADWYGGGMHNHQSSAPTVSDCAFTTNQADYGGGMSNDSSSSPIVTDCTFVGNTATGSWGGGMFNSYYTSPMVVNCIFAGNTADYGGGMMNSNWSSPTVTNCTFYGNSATTSGDGMYNDYYATPTVVNCILWDGGDEIVNANDAVPTVRYCDVQGGYTGTGNIDADPLFVNAAGGDYHIQPGSPCIDVGFGDAVPAGITTDFEGDPRFMDGDGDSVVEVDMGADECLAQVWVDDGWAGLNEGDPAGGHIFGKDAFATVGDGVDAVFPGGTVNVHPGTYIEKNIAIGKSLTVESVSGDWHDTIVDPVGGPVFQFISFGGDATISGLTITAGDYGIYIEGLYSDGSITVNNCFIYNNGTGIFGGDIIAGDIFIDDCIISENTVNAGIYFGDVSGTAGATRTVSITDSVIGAYWDTNTATGYAGNVHDGIAINIIEAPGNVLIDNNIIAQNGGNGISDKIFGCYGHLTITNNVIGAYDYDLATSAGYFTGNSLSGISIDYVGSTGVVTIEGNRIAQNYYGVSFGPETIAGEVTINNNYIGAWTDYTTIGDLYSHTFDGNIEKGIAVEAVAADGSLIIINNKIAENSEPIPDDIGLYINTTAGDTIIAANRIGAWIEDIPGGSPVSYGGNGGPGIRILDVAGGSLLIHGNTVAENIEVLSGIHIDAADASADISISLNNILDNIGDGVYYSGTGTLGNLDATNNWWGDASGPGGEGPGTGDEVSTNVDYEPWLGVSVEGAKAGTITDGTLDNIAGADTKVIVTGSATVTSAKYSGNPGSGFSGDIGKYIDVFIDDPAGVTEIEIRLYYTEADITGLGETSLTLRWWNGTGWVVCSDSGVNTTDITGPPAYSGYIWAKIRSDTTPTLAQLTGSVFGGGGALTSSLVWGGDTTAPRISNVLTCYDGVTETTADICWRTNEQSTSQVEYEASPGILSPLDETYVNEHHVHLTGLTPCTTYNYRTMSMDRAGNLAISDVYTFTTLGEAAFTSSDLSISPGEVSAGETVNISVMITNTSGCLGSYTVTLKINDVVEETSEVTLEPGVSESVTFTVSREQAGSYSVAIDGLSGSFSVAAPDTSQPAAEDEAPEDENPVNWPLIGGIIAGVVVLGLIILFVVRRRTT